MTMRWMTRFLYCFHRRCSTNAMTVIRSIPTTSSPFDNTPALVPNTLHIGLRTSRPTCWRSNSCHACREWTLTMRPLSCERTVAVGLCAFNRPIVRPACVVRKTIFGLRLGPMSPTPVRVCKPLRNLQQIKDMRFSIMANSNRGLGTYRLQDIFAYVLNNAIFAHCIRIVNPQRRNAQEYQRNRPMYNCTSLKASRATVHSVALAGNTGLGLYLSFSRCCISNM